MSAVIYAAIVVMWAVVLVPMWLKRHDAATESRSVERFSTAMRTLSRRSASSPARRYVVMPRRAAAGPSVHVSGAAATHRARPARRPVSAVARRRRLLLGLLVVTFMTMVLAVAGAFSWALQAVVDAILVAFCVHLRAQARQAAAVSRQRRRATVAPASADTSWLPPAPAPAVAEPAVVPAAQWAPEPATEVEVEPAAADEAPVRQPLVAWRSTGTEAAAGSSWEPVPVPRPTYTMKPPAPAYEADPTYSPPVYQRRAVEDEGTAVDAETGELDEILERRWAVND